MSVTINGTSGVTTPGIANSEGYTGDGLTIAAGAPAGAMTLDASGNLGIGTSSPSAKLHVKGSSVYDGVISVDNSSAMGGGVFNVRQNGVTKAYFGVSGAIEGNTTSDTAVYAVNNIRFYTNDFGSERMRLDASGNLGLGVVPSAWNTVTGLQVKSAAFGGTTTQAFLTSNAYYATGWKYTGSGAAAVMYQQDSQHSWFISPSGTAGNPITFTQAMTLNASGNLLVGYTSSNGSYKLQVNSQIFATSSTIATSDGRYKTNVVSLKGTALSLVEALNPVQFNWKSHPVHDFNTDIPTIGFLAQEVQDVLKDTAYVNSVVKESECELPDGTKEKFLGIAEGNLVALLTAAIQELKARIEQLETK